MEDHLPNSGRAVNKYRYAEKMPVDQRRRVIYSGVIDTSQEKINNTETLRLLIQKLREYKTNPEIEHFKTLASASEKNSKQKDFMASKKISLLGILSRGDFSGEARAHYTQKIVDRVEDIYVPHMGQQN